MTLTSWCAPSQLPPATVLLCLPPTLPQCALRPFESCQVICQQSESVQAASCHKFPRCSSPSLSSSLFLVLLSAAATATACRKLPVAVASYRILSGSSPCSFPPSLAPSPLRLFAMLRRLHSLSSTACLGQHDVASSVRRRFGPHFVRFVLRNC